MIELHEEEGLPPALDEHYHDVRESRLKVWQPQFDSKGIPQPLQFRSLLQFSDASLLARLLWLFPKHKKAISLPSGKSACRKCKLVVPSIRAHRYKLETKLVVDPLHRKLHLSVMVRIFSH